MRLSILFTALAAVSTPVTAQQFDAAKAFGAREDVEQISLSPDGTRLAHLVPGKGQGSGLYITPVDGSAAPKRILSSSGDPERISNCRWASNTRLLCSIYAIVTDPVLVTVSRVITLDSDGGNVALLKQTRGAGMSLGTARFGGAVIDWNPGVDNQVMMVREYVPEGTTGTRMAQTREGLGVDLVDVVTLRTKVVERADPSAAEFITDGRGVVRVVGRDEIREGYLTGRRNYFYRSPGKSQWEALSSIDMRNDTDTGFNPYAVDPALNVVYGLKRHNGRVAAFSKALDGSGTETLVFAHPQVDVTGFARIGRNGRVVGATFATDVPQVQYFDPAVAALTRSLSKAVPNLPLIHVVDSSEDEKRMLVWAGSDVDAGRYFLFDRTSKQLNELLLARPQLDGVAMATMRPITYAAADGTMIPAYLTLPAGGTGKNLPAIVMPHGGPGARDHWGFDWMTQFFANQGFAVIQPNFRGSTGYGDAWFQRNGFQGWRVAIGDVTDAGRYLVKEGIADPAKLNIVGWSYGGYAALQAAVTEPDLFKRVIAIAPVTDLDRLKEDSAAYSNAAIVARFVGTGPHIAEGSPARHAAKIKAPVLMFHGDRDQNVAIGQARLMRDRLKSAGAPGTLIEYKGLDHYLEDSAVRAEMLSKSAAFLKSGSVE